MADTEQVERGGTNISAVGASSVTRRSFLAAMALGGAAALLAACQASGQPGSAAQSLSTASAKVEGWDQVLEAAKKEGVVNVYGGISSGLREALGAPFERAFPSIKANLTVGPARDIVARLLAERQAGKYIPDVIVGPATESVLTLKPAGALAPLAPAFLLPEVSDPAKWFNNRFWWMDANEPYTTLRFQGYVGTTISYNTKLIGAGEFTSYRDLLNPKWKGKIVASDITRPGQGGLQVRFIYSRPELGPVFLDELFSTMNIVVSTDQRQMTDWLGQGRYPVGLWVSDTEVKSAASQGIPVALIASDQLKEGGPIASGGGTMNMADSAPHPNAAKVFVNWLLSRDGQIVWQDQVKQSSLRVDVPRDGLDPAGVPKPGGNYADIYTEKFFKEISDESITSLVKKALEKANSGA